MSVNYFVNEGVVYTSAEEHAVCFLLLDYVLIYMTEQS